MMQRIFEVWSDEVNNQSSIVIVVTLLQPQWECEASMPH